MAIRTVNSCCGNGGALVEHFIGTAYDVVKTVYDNLGILQYIYDFLNQHGVLVTVDSVDELKALNTDMKYARVYTYSTTAGYGYTDYLYVEGNNNGVIPNDPDATGTWVVVASSSIGGGNGDNAPAYIPYVYAQGSALGGETTIAVPNGTVGVPFIIIEGHMNTVGYGFTFDTTTLTVTLTQPLEVGDEVVLLLTGTPAVPDNPNISNWVQFNWLYNGGYAVGGEQVIAIPYTFEAIPAIYKNGLRYIAGLATQSYTVDAANQRILLTEPLATNDRLIVQIGGETTTITLSDRTIQEVARAANVHDNEVILSTNTTQYLNDMKILYDVVAQKSYALPTLPTNVYINSVSNGQLTYSPGNITVDLLPLPNEVVDTLITTLGSDYGVALLGSFSSVSALKAFTNIGALVDGCRVVVRSFLAGRDIGGGTFQWHQSATTVEDDFAVIKPSSITGPGRWINIKRGRLTPEECGCVPNDPAFDNGAALNRWMSQQHCIGSAGKFYKSTATIPTSTSYPIHIECPSMQLVTTVANVNGVEFPSESTRRIKVSGLESFAADGLNVTNRNKANGFYIGNSQEVTLKDIRCEGWKNAGVWWFEVNNMTIDGFVGWRNDWDGSALFSSGGDLVEWTSSAGLSKSCSITNFLCLSDGSQSISVNSLSFGRNIVINNGHCFTYDSVNFTPKTQANIKARHGITIGYNSNQTYGGGIKVSNVIIRDKGWTGIYRSGGSDGAVRYQPATISNVSIYDCGFGVNQNNIGAGILFGDVIDGDMINNCYVEGFANANNGAYKIQDSVGTGKLTLSNCVDRNSAGYGVHIATESVNVMLIGHRSIDAARTSIFLEAKSGATLFRSHTIDGCRIERVTDGYGIFLSNGVISANIKNNEIRGTSTDSTSNCAIRVNQNGQNINIRGNQIYGFAYGLWYNTYVDTTTIFPWGNNQFFGCINAHRFARTTGTSVAKVEPNYYDGGTPNRFSNGGVGTVNGTEEFRINGVPVT